MTNYEYCLRQIEMCNRKMYHYSVYHNVIQDFWKNAKIGFEKRICDMETEEGLAEHEVRQHENIWV